MDLKSPSVTKKGCQILIRSIHHRVISIINIYLLSIRTPQNEANVSKIREEKPHNSSTVTAGIFDRLLSDRTTREGRGPLNHTLGQ